MTSRQLADLLEDTPPEQRAQLIDAICDRGNLSSEVRGAMQGLVKAIAAVEELERARGKPILIDDPLVEELVEELRETIGPARDRH